ncbi:potassium-transporting ATPase subunit KdpC [Allostreptomyces psammosilenae]|uniref:Potassium-transporting ATPase KdpC subunit n=1 Tax=Allostreptomyces psammosilenae TaxID=1892865 RepID=A0A852ZPG3_9ACTN|nr:potassium-transporting ATPase subunit KdpC [Allostreptomyces psammosilenae]NYI03150.1 K+-transporting ATPase ATPase C chain [Allostreptomyces psammosilenae]
MHTTFANRLRVTGAAVRALLVLTLLLGLVYPLAVTGLARALFPNQASGSPVTVDGREVGSALIGQGFTTTAADGTAAPAPEWFQSRPSAGNHDALASGASNLAPTSPDLLAQVTGRRAEVAAFNGVDPARVPVDAATASGSGLDPHISEEYALLQVERVARERGLAADRIRALVAEHLQGRALGFLGEPRVNVLELNAALAALDRE